MKRKQIISALLIGMVVTSTANADTLGFRVGTGVWEPESSGTIRHKGTDADLKNDLKLADEQNSYTYAYIEHPLPMIPNIKIAESTLSSKGKGSPGKDFTFGDTGYTTASTITTELVLDHSDILLYWQLLDNWISFDLGIMARKFDGKLSVSDGTTTKQTNIDQTVPMLYAMAGLEIPGISDLVVSVEMSMVEYDGSSMQDITSKVSYTTSYLIGFEAGIRTFTVELDDVNGNYSNMEFTGSFANLFIHF